MLKHNLRDYHRVATAAAVAMFVSGVISSVGVAAESSGQAIHPRNIQLQFPTGRWVACLASGDPEKPQPQARLAIIVIHGSGGRSTNNMRWMVEAARRSGKLGETFVMAPQFHSADDTPPPGEHYWSDGGWAAGDLSTDSADRPKRLSSFAVADRLFDELSDSKRFPNLRRIVLAGHSAGGQFTNRYLAVGRLGSRRADSAQQIEYRFVVANPSSYLYLDRRRPAGDGFQTPEKPPIGYNHWRYGLEHRNTYASQLRIDQIRQNVFARAAWCLIGTADNQQDDQLAKAPPAMLEGVNRYDRWQNFRRYVALFPEWRPQVTFAEVAGVAHSGRGMFTSRAAREAMFGDAGSSESRSDAR
ncbi:MAG: hypothetical protein ABFC96_15440 [Thermoguttaceae bacterium]